MREKKHIDRLFQEKFKDFEASPAPQIWKNIESELDSKRKKRIVAIPLWAKIGGIAASLLLLLTIGSKVAQQSSTPIVDTNTKEVKPSSNAKKETNTVINDIKINTPIKTASAPLKTNQQETTTVSKNNSKRTIKQHSKAFNTNKQYRVAEAVSSPVVTNSAINKSTTNKLAASNTKYTNTTNSNNIDKTNLVNKKEDILQLPTNTGIANTGDNSTKQQESPLEEDNLKATSITEAIAEVETAKDDSKTSSNNSKKVANKWTVYANVAPVYYSSLGKGSHIDEQFVNNSKEGEINTSYGVTVGYTLNDRMKLRSGVNKLDLSYNTNDAIVYESVASYPTTMAAPAPNIDTKNKVSGKSVSISSFRNLNVNKSSSSFIENEITPVSLNQKMSFYEVPLEIEHNVVNKRVGINVIYGVSTFILEDNEVISELNGENTIIGESNNINPVSFSTNVGLGVNYKFSKDLKMNIEPTFKYQLNAFENTSGNFNPYVLGVYTGISYNF